MKQDGWSWARVARSAYLLPQPAPTPSRSPWPPSPRVQGLQLALDLLLLYTLLLPPEPLAALD